MCHKSKPNQIKRLSLKEKQRSVIFNVTSAQNIDTWIIEIDKTQFSWKIYYLELAQISDAVSI